MYENILRPLDPEVIGKIQMFWMIFAILCVVCLVGALLCNKFFAADTPETRRKAWKIMWGVYFVLVAAGIYFLISSLFFAKQVQFRTLIQAVILIGLGRGRVLISLKRKAKNL